MDRCLNFSLSKQQLWLCLPLFIAYAADVTATALGQSANYWGGAYQDVNEANPISHWFLSIHPLAYITYRIIVFEVISFLILILSMKIAKITSTFFFLAHTLGAYGWIKNVFFVGYWERIILLFFLTVIFTYAYTQAETQINQ